MAITNIPSNKNFLSPLGYKFTLGRAPTLNYNVQTARIPGVVLSEADQPTPFLTIPIASHITYNPLNVTFRVNEDLSDYLEIYNWMIGLGSPVSFDQYKELQNAPNGSLNTVYSDITMLVMNSSMRPNIKFTFYDAFPIEIGDLEFNTTDTDVNYIECNATFRFLRYDIDIIS